MDAMTINVMVFNYKFFNIAWCLNKFGNGVPDKERHYNWKEQADGRAQRLSCRPL